MFLLVQTAPRIPVRRVSSFIFLLAGSYVMDTRDASTTSWSSSSPRTDGGYNLMSGVFGWNGGNWGANATAGTNSQGPTPQYPAVIGGTALTNANGKIITKFRWTGGGTPPAKVIVNEFCLASAAWTTNMRSDDGFGSRSASNGFGDPAVYNDNPYTGQYDLTSQGTHLRVVDGGALITLETTVSASTTRPGYE